MTLILLSLLPKCYGSSRHHHTQPTKIFKYSFTLIKIFMFSCVCVNVCLYDLYVQKSMCTHITTTTAVHPEIFALSRHCFLASTGCLATQNSTVGPSACRVLSTMWQDSAWGSVRGLCDGPGGLCVGQWGSLGNPKDLLYNKQCFDLTKIFLWV